MWLTLLALSVVGLFEPQSLAWILVIQVLYQGVWCVPGGGVVGGTALPGPRSSNSIQSTKHPRRSPCPPVTPPDNLAHQPHAG